MVHIEYCHVLGMCESFPPLSTKQLVVTNGPFSVARFGHWLRNCPAMATTNSILKAIVWLCISLDWCARAHSSIAGDAIFSNRLLSALQNIDFDKFKREEFEEKKHIGGASLENGYNDLRCLQHLSDLRNALNSSKLWAIQGECQWTFVSLFAANRIVSSRF